MRTGFTTLAPVIAIVCMVAGCETVPETAQERVDLEAKASAALGRAQAMDAGIVPHVQGAVAVAVFPAIDKGGAGLGGAYGRGILFEKGVAVGYCDITQGTIGAQLGGQEYTEILIFKTQDAANTFKNEKFSFNSQATAVAMRKGVGTNVEYNNGVAVLTLDEAGLMGEASVGGQKFTYRSKANRY
jgi:lipid-binding SYLF domain-containing protein